MASTVEMTTEIQEKRGVAGRSPSPDARVISPATAVGTDLEHAFTSPAEPRSKSKDIFIRVQYSLLRKFRICVDSAVKHQAEPS